MSNIYFVYDQYGNITTAQTDITPPVPVGSHLMVADETITNATKALAERQNYIIQNGAIVQAATINIDRIHTINGRWDVWTLTVSTSDQTKKNVNLIIGNGSKAVTIPDGATSVDVTVNLHVSACGYYIPVIATGDGLIEHGTFIGGNVTTTPPIQTYTDGNGVVHVTPQQKNTLLSYWTSTVNPAAALADIATALGLLAETVYNDIVGALEAGTTPILTLSANKKNAVQDILTNIVAKSPTSLETAAPVPAQGAEQTYDIHYASWSRHWVATEQAFQSYADDLQEIPNLV